MLRQFSFFSLALVLTCLRYSTAMSWKTVNAVISFCWVALVVVFAAASIHARWTRRGKATIVTKDNRSLVGLLLQAIGIVVAVSFSDPELITQEWRLLLGVVLGPLDALLAACGPWQLGRHLRGQAIVTEDHELITSGPYKLFRHPLYAGTLWLTLATALVRSPWSRLMIGIAVYIVGTEIRVRVEDALLLARFPQSAPGYRRRVRAYIPFLR